MEHTATLKESTTTPREAVPAEVHEGIDFVLLDEKVKAYRVLTSQQGFSAALSSYAGEPVAVCRTTS